MLLTFQADQIRLQVAHAVRAAERRSSAGLPSPPSLNLVKKGTAVYLVSNGLPAPSGVANAVQAEPTQAAASSGAGEDLGPADFLEPILIESFAKTLASDRAEVRIVVRSTYINVLGGQPERAVASGVRPRAPGARARGF